MTKKSTVLISGKFAVIHSGHIRLFMHAHTLGDEVIVALDSKELAKEEIEWRLTFLSNQEFIDRVIVFEGDIKKLLSEVQPDFVLKGSEFASRFNIEAEEVKQYGGEIVFSSGSTYFSETDLISKQSQVTTDSFIKFPHLYIRRNNLDVDDLRDSILQFEKIRVCVIGDLIIDEYINCHPLGMSREEPTVVVTPIDNQKFLGGAGIVAAHTAGLGATTTLITLIGQDDAGEWGSHKVQEYGVLQRAILDKKRPTTLKQRYRSGNHTLLKISHLSQDEVSSDIQDRIVKTFESIVNEIDLLILSDFSYGALNSGVSAKIIAIAKKNNVVVAADSQTSSQIGNLSQFKGVNLITPTEIEARLELKDQQNGLAVVIENLRQSTLAESIILKLGADGVLLNGTSLEGEPMRMDALPSFNSNPIDTSGAGDSLLSAAALSMSVDRDLYKAALIGSLAASIQVSRVGNTPILREQLLAILPK
jgi:rfaE bifunctional protein kinase chain/domain